MKQVDEPEEFNDIEEIKKTEDYKDLRQQMKDLMPIRHNLIKQYFERFKFNKQKRDFLLNLAEEDEELTKKILEEDYVHFKDAIPEINQFLESVASQEAEKPGFVPLGEDDDQKFNEEGQTKKKTLKIKYDDIDLNVNEFNPFDKDEIKK